MKKLALIVLALAILGGCGPPPKYHDYRDYEYSEPQEEPLRFSSDPLLDSIYRARYLECLKNCADKKKCD